MIVWVWTLAASLGAAIAFWNMADAWRDLFALSGVENGRRILARGWIRREAIRFGIQVVWAAIGILALPTAGDDVSPVALLLIGTNVALAASTFFDARERRVLRRIIGG